MVNRKKVKKSFDIKKILNVKNLIISLVLVVILVIALFIFNNTQNREAIVLKTNLELEINSEARVRDLIESVKRKVKVINDEELIDTSVLGIQEITVIYQEASNEEKTINLSVTVLDKTKPVIIGVKDVVAIVGTKIDLLDEITVTDNSNEELEIELDGEYDLNKIGVYNLKYIASDSSGNTIALDFTLNVENYKVKHEGVYYWDDRNNDISIVFSGENDVETKTCRKWGENACSSKKGTYQIKNNKITITYTHYKAGYDDPKWLKLSSNSTQTLTIKTIDRLEQSSYIYNHMDI